VIWQNKGVRHFFSGDQEPGYICNSDTALERGTERQRDIFLTLPCPTESQSFSLGRRWALNTQSKPTASLLFFLCSQTPWTPAVHFGWTSCLGFLAQQPEIYQQHAAATPVHPIRQEKSMCVVCVYTFNRCVERYTYMY